MRWWLVAKRVGEEYLSIPFRNYEDASFAFKSLMREGYNCHIVEV